MPRSLQEIMDQAEALAGEFETFEPTEPEEVAVLRAAAFRRARAEADVAAAVEAAVLSGASWRQIGGAVGTSPQAAHQRYAAVAGAHRRHLAGVSDTAQQVPPGR